MARLYKDGASVAFNATTGKFESVLFGENSTGPKGFQTPAANVNGAYEPFDYVSATTFAQQVDNSAMGNARDCGECHVGGGGMQYLARNEGWDGTAGPAIFDAVTNSSIAWIQDPAKSYPSYIQDPAVTLIETPDGFQDFDEYGNLLWEASPRIELRGANSNTAIPGGALDETKVTAWNYFIDIFDEDGDLDHSDVLYNDFTKTGVVEMDCLMCHMTGYDWKASKDAKRIGKFDASRAAGAGFGTPAAIGYTNDVADLGYGTTVDYDPAVVAVVDTNPYAVGDQLGAVVNLQGKLHAVPPTDNCASCHQGKYQVDWKKRGEMSAATDVHASIGCMGCHERKEEVRGVNPNTGLRDSRHLKGETVGISLNIRDGKLGHDPAKGSSMPWDSLNNINDGKEFKECVDCHSGTDMGARGKSFGAPNPAGAHAAAGLSAMIVQKKGNRSGVADGSHLDIISCDACHIDKSQAVPHQMTDHSLNTIDLTYASGGNFVDGTGLDHEGRLATHDTYEVSREMFDGTNIQYGFNWAKDGKIHAGNFLTSLFWRDKNDKEYDVNADGRPHGMDAVLPTHVNDIINWDHSAAILADGVSDDAEVTSHINALVAGLGALNGKADPASGIKMKLSWVTVPFTMSHNIGQSNVAWGAGGCTDCHGGGKNGGFYTGTIDANGFASFGFNAATQTAPMTKANGMSEKTFGHPNMKDKFGVMSIPLMNNNAPGELVGQTNTIRDMEREEALYQTTFQTRDGSFKTVLTGANIQGNLDGLVGVGTWKGWYLNIEVDTDNDDVVESDASIWLGPGNAATGTPFAHPDATPTVAELLANFPAAFTNNSNTYGFNIAEGLDSNLVITAAAGNEIRVAFNSFYGPFGLKGETVIAAPITPTCQDLALNGGFTSLTGRADMVNYLNALGADADADGFTNAEECFSIGIVDAPVIGDIGGVTAAGGTTPIELAAGTTVTLSGTATSGSTTTFTVYDIFSQEGDAPLTLTGNDVTFANPGTYRIVLESQTVEGKLTYDTQYIVVNAPLDGVFTTSTATDNGDGTFALNVVIDPATLGFYDSVLVNFSDGDANLFYSGAATTFTKDVAGVTGDVKRVSVIFKNGLTTVDVWEVDITL